MAMILAMNGPKETREKIQRADLFEMCLGSVWMVWPKAKRDAITWDRALVSEDCIKGLRADKMPKVPVAAAVHQEEYLAWGVL